MICKETYYQIIAKLCYYHYQDIIFSFVEFLNYVDLMSHTMNENWLPMNKKYFTAMSYFVGNTYSALPLCMCPNSYR